ncbi:ASCH domain-containing protein [Leptospira wolffii]|uniref:ASCH domain-containing protein n=1 Tax=Leptospira wolffii TaxID=409998 RepID=A0ABV5BQ85_9LEPT|nr:ASCH domain-containing protein [Leptospira wolffii]EPG65780.1 ASCH domain protein [Leptospira wolffii serovar Khorat str. Khorat-H2]
MAKTKNRRVVFLPIKPEFAHKIINGEKNIEFRKKFSSQDVETIVIYSSSPEKRIIGYATVDSIVIDTPDSLWKRFCKKSGIDKERFSSYFNGKETGIGIRIKSVSKLKEAVTPTQLGIEGAIPQNFKFLEKSIIAKLERKVI